MTPQEWFTALCERMGWPATAANLAIMDEWARREGMYNPAGLSFSRGYNPWMTTYSGPEAALSGEDLGLPGLPVGWWNSQGVKMYATPEDGLRATVATFRQGGGPGWYGALDTAFHTQTWTPGVLRAWQIWIVGPNASPDQHAYDEDLSKFALMRWAVGSEPVPTPAGVGTVQARLVEDLILAVFAGSEEHAETAPYAVRPRDERLAAAMERLRLRADGQERSVADIAASAAAPAMVPAHRHEMQIAVSRTGGVER